MQRILMTKDRKRRKYLYIRICDKCGETYRPTGRTQKVCKQCQIPEYKKQEVKG